MTLPIILLGLLAAVVAIVVLASIKKDSPLAPLGINIKRTHCPTCNQKQPIMRKPANQQQMLFGGYTCKNCGTEMDKYGTKINANN